MRPGCTTARARFKSRPALMKSPSAWRSTISAFLPDPGAMAGSRRPSTLDWLARSCCECSTPRPRATPPCAASFFARREKSPCSTTLTLPPASWKRSARGLSFTSPSASPRIGRWTEVLDRARTGFRVATVCPTTIDGWRLLLTDAARGLQALHQAGLIHGKLEAESLRTAARTNRLRLHDLPSMPLMIDGREHVPPADDLADLAAAVAVLVTGQQAPPRSPRAEPIARALHRANPGLDPVLAQILGRCRATELPDRLDRADELITTLEPLTGHRVVLAKWGDRLVTLVIDCVLGLIVYLFNRLMFPATSRTALLVSTAFVPIIWFPVVLPLFEICLGWSPGRRARGLRLVDVSGTRAGSVENRGVRTVADRLGRFGHRNRIRAHVAGASGTPVEKAVAERRRVARCCSEA